MLFLAIVFEEERTTFLDLSFHMFVQATTGKVAIQNYRFVSVITQWIPTQLFNAEVNMKTVQLVYSLMFPLFYGAVWAFTHFVLKAKQWALAWALMWLTFASHTHFWIQSELPQGLAVFIVALGLISYQPDRKWMKVLAKAILALSLLTVAFAHPLLLIPVTFCFGFLWLQKEHDKKLIKQVASVYYFSFLLKSLVFRSPYDASAGGGIKVGLMTLLELEIPYAAPHFFENLANTYYLFLVVTALGIWLLWKSGQKQVAAWTLAALGAQLAIVTLSYSTEVTPDFYRENLYLPAGFIGAVGFSFGVFNMKIQRVPVITSILLITVLMFRMLHISWIGDSVYAPRLLSLQALLDTHKETKVILKETPLLRERLILTWGTGYEAWVYSSRREKPTQGFLVHEDPAEIQWAIDDPSLLILQFHHPKFSELPKKYFTQPKESQKYRLID